MRHIIILFLFIPILAGTQVPPDSASVFIKKIYRQAYTDLMAYKWLTTLTKNIGHRLSGSPEAAEAVKWANDVLDTLGLDSVWLQEVKVPHWVRGEKEQVTMLSKDLGAVSLTALALGNSGGTGNEGVRGEVVEVQTLDQLRSMPDERVKGKIVFFNRPMDLGLPSTMSAYGGAGDQRNIGPSIAAEKGAMAAVVRSLSTRQDDYPHTGATRPSETAGNIPAVAISTNDADLLTKALTYGPVSLFIRTKCQTMEDATSYNVIGEIKGSVYPDQIILVGGHLDSWDVGEGANDDGAGCVHSIEALYRLAHNGYKPRHTLRCVLFMNEENGGRGGKKYADEAGKNNEYHLAAIESDAGGSVPLAFGCSTGADTLFQQHLDHMSSYMNLLEPYYLRLEPGGAGSDINPLKSISGILIGLRPDNARYFDVHHSNRDVLENVHPRELASGAAAMASLVFLLDQYGI